MMAATSRSNEIVGCEPYGWISSGPPANGRRPRVVSRVVTRSKKALEQVHLCLGTAGYAQTHPDRYRHWSLTVDATRVSTVLSPSGSRSSSCPRVSSRPLIDAMTVPSDPLPEPHEVATRASATTAQTTERTRSCFTKNKG